MDQPNKLRIRNPNIRPRPSLPQTSTHIPEKKSFLQNEDLIFGITLGAISVIILELVILIVWGLFGAIFSSIH